MGSVAVASGAIRSAVVPAVAAGSELVAAVAAGFALVVAMSASGVGLLTVFAVPEPLEGLLSDHQCTCPENGFAIAVEPRLATSRSTKATPTRFLVSLPVVALPLSVRFAGLVSVSSGSVIFESALGWSVIAWSAIQPAAGCSGHSGGLAGLDEGTGSVSSPARRRSRSNDDFATTVAPRPSATTNKKR